MAKASTPKTRARGAKAQAAAPPVPDAKPPALDGSTLSLEDLAEAVLARRLKPRAADLQRLAEGVLKRKKGGSKKDASKKAGGKKTKNKLPKIPGQKKRKDKA